MPFHCLFYVSDSLIVYTQLTHLYRKYIILLFHLCVVMVSSELL